MSLRLRGIDKQMRFRRSSDMLHDRTMILDVGGGTGDFFDFASCSGVVADLPPDKSLFGRTQVSIATVYFDGVRLPFKDKSFETVVSLDTLEHVSKDRRSSFLLELQRVSRSNIILTFPERQFFLPVLEAIALLYDVLGISRFMRKSLEEHRRFGLPSRTEVLKDVEVDQWTVWFTAFMGRGATFLWILQLFLPFLAIPVINDAICNALLNGSTEKGGECLISMSRARGANMTHEEMPSPALIRP